MPAMLLTTEMLDELQALLREGGARLATSWRPQSRTREQIAEEMAGIGLGLPVELATWWAWHDGVEGESFPYRTVGAWEPLSVKDAVEATRLMRHVYATIDEPAFTWDPAWVMICFDGSRGRLFCDATVAEDLPSPVYCAYDDGWDGPSPAFPSLGELVAFWVGALRSGARPIDEQGAFALLPPERKEALWGYLGDLI